MSRMLRNSRNDRSTWTDTCECGSCSRGSNDRMVRRMQRARERDRFLREAFDDAADAREDDHADLIEHLMSEHL